MNAPLRKLAVLTPLVLALVACNQPPEVQAPPVANVVEARQLAQLAQDLYVYGYTPVIMELTRRVATNETESKPSGRAPLNQFGHVRLQPDASFTDVVAPNLDTLYSSAFLNVSKEPLILSVPDTKGRYYLMPMLDIFSNVSVAPGSRTTGTSAGNFAIVTKGWQGELPQGVERVEVATPEVWIIGRTAIQGKGDVAAVNKIQDQYKLTPLSQWGNPGFKPVAPPLHPEWSSKTAPARQIEAMDAQTFFTTLHQVLQKNRPLPDIDTPFFQRLAALGFSPEQPFDWNALNEERKQAYVQAVAQGLAAIRVATQGGGEKGRKVNGWFYSLSSAKFGSDYLYRASVAMRGLGNNVAEDAIYYNTYEDGSGQKLNGANQYVIRYEKGQTPPVNAFWSVTLYDAERFLYDNELDRYALGDRDKLKVETDGSIELYLQHERPSESKVSNWLPTPAGDYSLSNRVYWPKQVALDDKWTPPAVRLAE